MLGHGSVITAPDGRDWRVRRRWVERPWPNLRQRFRIGRKEVDGGSPFDGLTFIDIDVDDGWPALALTLLAVTAIVVFILLPLLGIALELIVLLVVLLSGLFARIVLRRPWVIEAAVPEDPEERVAFAVVGWRDSTQALRELRTAIAGAGPPEQLSVGRALATKPAHRRDENRST